MQQIFFTYLITTVYFEKKFKSKSAHRSIQSEFITMKSQYKLPAIHPREGENQGLL